ncbi:MAG: MerR family transcriptional regulator [Lachnospiraceae bacterium]|nr:MerR family transcriptional regulator [Lachnospiraceae bacterium]
MKKVRYMISDASNLIQVESHVLRYWEEELELDIPRNEMGHRYYTEENIRQFEQIRKWKEEGYQLKAIRMMIHSLSAEGEEASEELPGRSQKETVHMALETTSELCPEIFAVSEESDRAAEGTASSAVPEAESEDYEIKMIREADGTADAGAVETAQKQTLSKLEQFQMMMNEIVKQAIAENNRALGEEISLQVGEKVIKEMNYLMRDREEQEEERFRRLDETIRNRQKRSPKEKRTFFRTSIHKAQEMS